MAGLGSEISVCRLEGAEWRRVRGLDGHDAPVLAPPQIPLLFYSSKFALQWVALPRPPNLLDTLLYRGMHGHATPRSASAIPIHPLFCIHHPPQCCTVHGGL